MPSTSEHAKLKRIAHELDEALTSAERAAAPDPELEKAAKRIDRIAKGKQ